MRRSPPPYQKASVTALVAYMSILTPSFHGQEGRARPRALQARHQEKDIAQLGPAECARPPSRKWPSTTSGPSELVLEHLRWECLHDSLRRLRLGQHHLPEHLPLPCFRGRLL